MDMSDLSPGLPGCRQHVDPTFIRLLYELREAHELALAAVRAELTSKRDEQSFEQGTEARNIIPSGISSKRSLPSMIIDTEAPAIRNSFRSNVSKENPRTRKFGSIVNMAASTPRAGAKDLAKEVSYEQSCSTNPFQSTASVIDPNASTKSKPGLLQKQVTWSMFQNEVSKVRTWGKRSSESGLNFGDLSTAESAPKPRVSLAAVPDLHHYSWCKRLEALRDGKVFSNACGGAIVLNIVILGCLANVNAQNYRNSKKPPWYLDVPDKCCSIWFFIELLIRLTGGFRTFFCGSARCWNMFDFSLVSLDLVDTTFSFLVTAGNSPVKNLVALRALRLFRVLRIVRLLQFCQDLQVMVHCITMCGKSLLWASILVILIIYLFALYFMQQVTDHLATTPEIEQKADFSTLWRQWGNLWLAVKTLYMVMSGGVSWIEVSEPLIRIHEGHGLTLFFYVFFTMFVLTNIITSIFVDTAIQATNGDRESVIARKLKERDKQLYQMITIFKEADHNATGFLTLENFTEHTKDPRVRAYLRSVDLDVTEATSLFALMDADGSGILNITEFVFGCMRLKGPARSIDLAILMHDTKMLHETLDEVKASQAEQLFQSGYLQTLIETHRRSQGEAKQSPRRTKAPFSL